MCTDKVCNLVTFGLRYFHLPSILCGVRCHRHLLFQLERGRQYLYASRTHFKVLVPNGRTQWGVSEQEMIRLLFQQHFRMDPSSCPYSRQDMVILQRGLLAAPGVKPPFEHLHFPYALLLKVLCSSLVLIGPHSANQGKAMPEHVHPIKGTAAHAPILAAGSVTSHTQSPAHAIWQRQGLGCVPLFIDPSPSPSARLS